jgi:hypothetical protein
MSGTGAAPGADHGWLAKVLAGDRLACGVLDLARNLPEPEWDAFAQRCEQRPACVPAADLGLQQECGRVPA